MHGDDVEMKKSKKLIMMMTMMRMMFEGPVRSSHPLS